MADDTKPIDLRSLQNAIAGTVELNGGVYQVRKLNVVQYKAALAIHRATDPDVMMDGTVQLVAEITGMPVADVAMLPGEVLAAIIALAMQGVEAVEALLPNAASPESSSSTSPG